MRSELAKLRARLLDLDAQAGIMVTAPWYVWNEYCSDVDELRRAIRDLERTQRKVRDNEPLD